ncbi:hypothetical protein M434DRAFT_33893 [Hypoxylon sp. CO27-5]|nr:hypothetical protein M434DRAFT_33893 [Hypoxylon sp. CO27-5]
MSPSSSPSPADPNPITTTTTTTINSSTTKGSTINVRAIYTNSNHADNPSPSPPSSTTSFNISTPLSLPNSDSTAYKTAYLSNLREVVSALQESVNSELTARMEEEAREVAATSTTSITNGKVEKSVVAAGVDEAAEEENYGEEVVGDDEE